MSDDPLADTLHGRGDVLALVQDEPLSKRDVVEHVDVSRSTVDRAIRDLEADGLVERTADGYVATVAGRVAADARDTYRRTVSGVARARSLLALLPRDAEVAPEMVAGAEVVHATAPSPSAPLDRLRERIEASDRHYGMSAAETGTGFPALFYESVVADELDLEFVFTEPLFEHFREQFVDEWREMHSHGFDVYAISGFPYGLALCETPVDTTAALVVYDQQSRLAGILFNDDPDAVAWVRERYERYRDRATRMEPPAER